MKFIGPLILIFVLLLSAAVLWVPPAVWTLGGVTIALVFGGIIATFVADFRAHKAKEE
jgi:hypothetical protein